MLTISASDMQNNFDEYLHRVQQGEEIIITINNIKVAKLEPVKTRSFITESLTGILANDYNEKAIREEQFSKYKTAD